MLLFLQLYWALISLKSCRPNVICEKVFLKISQISQKNNCVGVCIYYKIADVRAATLLKKIPPYRCFFFCKDIRWMLPIFNLEDKLWTDMSMALPGKWNTHFFRCSPPEVSLEKGVLKIWSKFTEERPCRSVISIKLL